MYLFNGICLTDNLVKNLHRIIFGLKTTVDITLQRQTKTTIK